MPLTKKCEKVLVLFLIVYEIVGFFQVKEWNDRFDIPFRRKLAMVLNKSNRRKKRNDEEGFTAEDVVYVAPSPIKKDGELLVAVFVRSSGPHTGTGGCCSHHKWQSKLRLPAKYHMYHQGSKINVFSW